jgi:single-stranded DNA-binding protein
MTGIAEFKIIGRVGAIKNVGTTVRVSIAANYSYKNNQGDWVDNVKWNEITIFNEATQGFVKRNLTTGDMVYADGIFGQTSYERGGERVYGMTLACQRIERLAKADGRHEAAEQHASSPAQMEDASIPF